MGEEFAFGIIDVNPVQPLIGNVGVPPGVQGHPRRPDNFAVGVAVLAELAEPLLVLILAADVKDADPGAVDVTVPGGPGDILCPPVHHVDLVFASQPHRYRGVETGAAHGAPADEAAVLKDSACH